MNHKLRIVIATLNSEKFLKKTLQSLQNQVFTTIEIQSFGLVQTINF